MDITLWKELSQVFRYEFPSRNLQYPSQGELQGCVRVVPPNVVDHRRPYYLSDDSTKKYLDSNRNLIALDGGILVSGKPNWEVPKEALRPG